MYSSALPDPPIDIAILIEDAQDAQVAAHIRIVLSRFKSHVKHVIKPEGGADA